MFTVDTTQINELNKQIESINKRGTNLEKALDKVSEVVREDIKIRFMTAPTVEQGGIVHGGIYWKPLSQYTIRTFNRQGGQILTNTGALMRSLTVKEDPNHISKFENGTFVIGTNIDYAEKHQPPNVDITSLDNNDNHLYGEIPPRPFVFYHDKLVDKISNALEEYITTGDSYA